MKLTAAACLLLLAAGAAFAEGYVLPEPTAGVTGFRPFGWSADGKFAWLQSTDIEGRGGTDYTYTVYDAVEDSTVYTHSDDSFDWGTDVDATEAESWKRSGDEVSAALTKYGIVQARDITIQAFPLQRAGDRYTASLKVQNDPTKDETDDQRVQAYSVILTSRSRGSKVVTTKDKVGAAKVELDGYILSPLEPRILVVVGVHTRAFEGYDTTLYYYGAHLGLGFKK
jgi:hypothetical protein